MSAERKVKQPIEITRQKTLTSLSATELAAMIARGGTSSVEAVEAHIERIERVNPALNAVVVKRYDRGSRTHTRRLPGDSSIVGY